MFQRLTLSGLVLTVVPGFVYAQFVSYDALAFPEDTAIEWIPQFTLFPAKRLIDGGWFQQAPIVFACPPVSCTTRDYYLRAIGDHAGTASWFVEWRVISSGPIFQGNSAPSSIVAAGKTGVLYHFTIARDRVRMIRGGQFPIVYADIQPGVVHRFRLELDNAPPTGYYRFTIDGHGVDEGPAEAYYPTSDSYVVFGAQGAVEDSITRWDSIRFGRIPDPGSGDMNSDGLVDLGDLFFMDECIADTGPDQPTRAGCLWADLDADGDVDLLDFAEFQAMFTGPGE